MLVIPLSNCPSLLVQGICMRLALGVEWAQRTSGRGIACARGGAMFVVAHFESFGTEEISVATAQSPTLFILRS
jgi:hypothetical protein